MVTPEKLSSLAVKFGVLRIIKKPMLSLFIREHLREKGAKGDFLYDIYTAWNKFKLEINPNYHTTSYESFRSYINRLKRLRLVIQEFEGAREYERWEHDEKRTRFKKSRYRIARDRM